MGRDAALRVAKTLRDALGSDRVTTEAAGYRLGAGEPAFVVFAHAEAEVARVLALATEEGLGVVPWGGGAHQAAGGCPNRYDVALDLRHLNRILAYEPADMTVTTEAGIRLADLQRRLGEHRQFWPLDPPLAEQATLGGVVAANVSGPLRCRYGTVRDLVLGVRVAHADGTITKAGARVVKNATAYDLTKLYAGSYGTLGVLLEATLRLQPRPAVERGWWVTGATIEQCHDAAMRILGSHLAATRVELLDNRGVDRCGGPAAAAALFVSFAGVKEAVEDQGHGLEKLTRDLGLRAAAIADPAAAFRALQDFPWRCAGVRAAAFRGLWRGSVLPSDCAKAMQAVRDAAAPYGTVAIAATVSHGVLRGELCAPSAEAVAGGVRAGREALGLLGGFLVVLEAPHPLRSTLDRWGPAPPEVELMRQIRAAFDKRCTVNPGRFVGEI